MPVPLDQRPRSGPYSGLNARSAKRFLTAQFTQAGLDMAEADALALVLAATQMSRSDFVANGTEFLSQEVFATISDYAARRLSGEPVDNILGYRDFYGRRFKVTKDVLSPREDTEVLITQALAALDGTPAPRILDLGTGSGAILTTLLCERPDASGVGVDVSSAALDVTQANAQAHGVNGRAEFILSDWFEGVPPDARFDLIISNPPYIDADHMAALPRDVADFDPALALSGGADGLDAYRVIAREAPRFMAPNARLILEIGYDQGVSVPDILRAHGLTDVAVYPDLGGHDRCVSARAR